MQGQLYPSAALAQVRVFGTSLADRAEQRLQAEVCALWGRGIGDVQCWRAFGRLVFISSNYTYAFIFILEK